MHQKFKLVQWSWRAGFFSGHCGLKVNKKSSSFSCSSFTIEKLWSAEVPSSRSSFRFSWYFEFLDLLIEEVFQVFLNVKFLDFEIELGVQVFPNDPHFILQRKTHERCHLRRPAGHLLGFSFYICHLSHDDDKTRNQMRVAIQSGCVPKILAL